MGGSGGLTVDVHLGRHDLRAALERDVRLGLGTRPKSIPPIWFYDEEGSRLFDEITRLPEYYPTRAERALLGAHAGEVAALSGADSLVELGAGSCDKTRLLLDALAARGPVRRYLPFDVSDQFLRTAAEGVADDYAPLEVHAVVGDFHRHLDRIPGGGRRLVAFLGGTIGNLRPAERRRFLARLADTLGPDDTFLLGADLVKDPARLVAAYDDRAGVTAAFNRNVLHVINRELGADFDPTAFVHVARWDAAERWIEMRLRSVRDQVVSVEDLGMRVHFAAGEDLVTEISAKFGAQGVTAELSAAGLRTIDQWGADEGEFSLTLAGPR